MSASTGYEDLGEGSSSGQSADATAAAELAASQAAAASQDAAELRGALHTARSGGKGLANIIASITHALAGCVFATENERDRRQARQEFERAAAAFPNDPVVVRSLQEQADRARVLNEVIGGL